MALTPDYQPESDEQQLETASEPEPKTQKQLRVSVDTIREIAEQQDADETAINGIHRQLGVEPSRETANEPQHVFSFEGIDHAMVKRFQPRYLAHGGNQIVYDVPSMSHLVVKADGDVMRQIIAKNIEHCLPLDSLYDRKEVMQHLKRERARFRRMESHFGKDHVLAQARILRKVPVTDRILSELYDGKAPGKTEEAWTAITLQERAEVLRDSDRLNLVSGYAEIRSPLTDENTYASITQTLLEPSGQTANSDTEKFLNVQNNEDLTRLVHLSGQDDQLRAVLKDLVGKVIAYSRDTGEILDLAGSDNIVISKKNGQWTYILLDALYPGEFDTIEDARRAIEKTAAGQQLNRNDQSCLFNVLNFTRTINGLAHSLGIKERVDILPVSAQGKDLDFKKALADIIRAHEH